MAVLTDQNLVNYKKAIDDLKVQVSAWTKYLSDAETALNSSTGKTFRDEYTKGNNATKSIQEIIDILQSLKSSSIPAASADYYIISVTRATKDQMNQRTVR